MAVRIPIKTEGGQQSVNELKKVGDAGQSALDRINRASREPAAGLRILNGGVIQLKGGLEDLSGRAGTVGRIVGALGPVGLTAAAGLGVVGITLRTVMAEADKADKLGKVAQSVGVAVESLSALNYAASLSDVSLESLATGLKKLSVNAIDTARGTGEAKDAFAALGINVRDASGNVKSADAILAEVADKFAGAEDGANKTAIAVKLFGKAGADLIPLLNAGSDGLAQMAGEAQKLGVIITTETAKSAELFNDNLTRMNAASQGLKIALANELLPGLSSITTAMAEAAKEAGLLQAAWVGLGGLGAALFTNEFASDVEKLRDLQVELSTLQRRLRDKGSQGNLHDWIYGDEIDLNAEIDATVVKMAALQDKIQRSKASPVVPPEAKKQLTELATSTGKLSDAQKAANKEVADYNRRLESLVGNIDPVSKSTEDYMQAVADLDRAWIEGSISGEEHDRLIMKLATDNKAVTKSTEDAAKAQEKAAEERRKIAEKEAEAMRKPFEHAAEGIQDSFTDAFANIFSGNVDSFKDLANSIKGVFVRLAAEIATLMVFNPRASFGSVVGGLGVFGSSTASAGAQLAGTTASGGGGFTSVPGGSTFAQAGGGYGGAFLGAAGGAYYGYQNYGTRGAVIGGVAGYAGGAALTSGGAALAAGWGAGASGGAALAGAGSALAAIPVWGWAALAALAIFGSKIGPKPSDMAAGGVVNLGSGVTSGFANQTGDKFSQQNVDLRTQALDYAAQLSGAIADITGGAITKSLSVVVGNRDGLRYTFSGSATQNAGSDVEAFMAGITKGIINNFSGIPKELKAVVNRLDFTNLEAALADLQVAAFIINKDFIAAEPLNAAAQAIQNIKDQYAPLIDTAKRLKIATSSLVAEQNKQIALLKTDFNSGIDAAILAITDPLQAALNEFDAFAAERLENAKSLGADLVDVEELNALERARIVEQYGAEANASLLAANENIESFLTSIRSGSGSLLSPAATLANAEADFDTVLAAAQAGDIEALSEITNAASNLISASQEAWGSTEMFFDRLGFIDSTLSNLIGETSTTTFDNIGITIAEGNAEMAYLTQEVIDRLDTLTIVVADQQSALDRLAAQ